MLLGKRVYHAVKVVLFFAFSGKESYSIKEISVRIGISEKTLEQVLLSLKKGGVLSSKRGPQGGYWLTADISDMSLMDMVEISGESIEVMPQDHPGKKEVIDEVLMFMSREIADETKMKLEGIKIEHLVEKMENIVTDKGMTYFI